MSPMTLSFLPMTPAHLSGAVKLSVEAGWPHRREDWDFVHGISNGVVARDGDRVVATALATPYGNAAMVNLVIVERSLRGRGVGQDIMGRAMATVSLSSWRLVATEDGLPLYEKLGFRAVGSIVQHQGVIGTIRPGDGVTWASAADLAAMIAMDRAASGMDRSSLYQALSHRARFAVLRTSDGITGLAALRPFGKGQVIGPVVAGTITEAQNLVSFLMSGCAGQFLRVDTGTDTGLGPWLAARGLPESGAGLVMQRGEDALPEAPSSSVFALASQALG